MGQTHVDGISQQELMAFQEEFGPTAFVCDFRRCERATFGFSSKARLVDHRARHDGILKCPVQGCAYNDVGFTTIKSLRGHQRNRHGGAEIKRVPKRFRQTLHEEANTWSHVPEYSYPALAEHQVQIVRWQDENQRRRLMTATQQQDNVSNIAPEKQHSNSALENYNSEKGTWKANKEPSDRDLSNFEIFEQQNENLLLMIARQELHNAVAEQESLGI
jgi:hypothetical protein